MSGRIAVNALQFAPSPKQVDGLLAVPIDIESIDATLYFDAVAQRAEAEVHVEFLHGICDGYPIFDLRQTIGEAWLDGEAIDPARLAHHDFGAGPDARLRIIEKQCKAGSAHTLRLRYPLQVPDAPPAGSRLPALEWRPEGVHFRFGFTDLAPGRYLDAWLPANLIYDQFQLDIGITITGTAEKHAAIHNGNWSTQVAANRWWIEYRRYSTAFSPMLELHPALLVRSRVADVMLPVSGKKVTIEIWKDAGNRTSLGRLLPKIAAWLSQFENTMGRYVHGKRFVVFLQERGGMEYDGGCTSSIDALFHEVFHSWWARGLKPATQNDGWIDEAWTIYCDESPDEMTAIDWSAPPVILCPENEWSRLTPRDSYSAGPQFFRGLAHLLGSPRELHARMEAFYKAHAPGFITTAALHEHLMKAHPLMTPAFERFVYGRLTLPATADAGAGTRTSQRHGSGAGR
jgi:hypothetical protein